MNFFKTTLSKTILAVSLLCIMAIVFHIAVVNQKNSVIKNLESEISVNNSAAAETSKKIEALEKEIETIKEASEKTSKELDEQKKSNSSLKKENDSLKKENSDLKKKNSSIKNSSKTNSSSKKASTQTTTSTTTQSGKKVCYLTFDDGPSENTLKILDILKKNNVKATFFVINTSKSSYIKKIHAAGHTVGLHSYTHQYNKIYKNSTAYFNDLTQISNLVKKYTGIESKIIRFPGGSSNTQGLTQAMRNQVIKKGYYYFDWNVDSLDASGHNVSYTKICNSVLTSAKNKSSICVLMHDTDAKNSTVTALPYIITGLKKQGFTFEALTEKSPGFRHR